jgi:hypothetical protein
MLVVAFAMPVLTGKMGLAADRSLFPEISVMSGLGWTSISKTSWMRLG